MTTATKPDRYDEALEFFRGLRPAHFAVAVNSDWNHPTWAPGGVLFAHASDTGGYETALTLDQRLICGCLTQLRDRTHPRAVVDGAGRRPDLEERIRADERLPRRPDDISPENLPAFAEWQRILDAELKRGAAADDRLAQSVRNTREALAERRQTGEAS